MLRDTIVDVVKGQLVLIEAGRRELIKSRSSGRADHGDTALQAGTKLRTDWAAKNVDVTVDPRFGTFSQGSLQGGSGSLSVPVSSRSKSGAAPTALVLVGLVAAGQPEVQLDRARSMSEENDVPGARLLELVGVMDRLRRDCPWDREQTHRSLAKYLLEETYETLEAIETGDLDGSARGARRPAAPGVLPLPHRAGGR